MPATLDTLQRSIARSLDLSNAALRLAPKLFSALDSLGSSPRRVAGWLAGAGVRPRHRVLDLGCGKGAAAVAIARRCGCQVTGIDGFEPFVQSAWELADARGVGKRCLFRQGDLRTLRTQKAERYDAAIMLGVRPALEAAACLLTHIKPGGVMVIDDAVCVRNRGRAPEGETRRELREAFTAMGFAVEREHVMSRSEAKRMEDRLQRELRRSALALRAASPRDARMIDDIVQRQREAAALLQGPLRPALWLLRAPER